MYSIVYDKKAVKDIPKLKAAKLDSKAKALIDLIRENPFKTPPPYEKLQGELQGVLSRRINIQHRLVYQVIEEQQIVKIISMWTHYDTNLTLKECLNEKCTVAKIQGNSTFFISSFRKNNIL